MSVNTANVNRKTVASELDLNERRSMLTFQKYDVNYFNTDDEF